MGADPVHDTVRTASIALVLGGIAAVTVAMALPRPERAILPLVAAGAVLLAIRRFLDVWPVPHDVWMGLIVAAGVVFLDPDPTSIVLTSVFLAILGAIGSVRPDLPARFLGSGPDADDPEK